MGVGVGKETGLHIHMPWQAHKNTYLPLYRKGTNMWRKAGYGGTM